MWVFLFLYISKRERKLTIFVVAAFLTSLFRII